ncbi:MAG: hypothetical protein RLY63_748, partial [Chloroflexota bacterium]
AHGVSVAVEGAGADTDQRTLPLLSVS